MESERTVEGQVFSKFLRDENTLSTKIPNPTNNMD